MTTNSRVAAFQKPHLFASSRTPRGQLHQAVVARLSCRAFVRACSPSEPAASVSVEKPFQVRKSYRGVGKRGQLNRPEQACLQLTPCRRAHHTLVLYYRRPGYWNNDANLWAELEPQLVKQADANLGSFTSLPKLQDLHNNGFGALAQAISRRGGAKKVASKFNLCPFPRDEQAMKQAERMRGVPRTEAQKEALRAAATGRVKAEETKQKISAALKGKGRTGCKHSEESKQKMKLSHQARKRKTEPEPDNKAEQLKAHPVRLAQLANEFAALRRELTNHRDSARSESGTRMSLEEVGKLSPELEKKYERFVELRDVVRSM